MEAYAFTPQKSSSRDGHAGELRPSDTVTGCIDSFGVRNSLMNRVGPFDHLQLLLVFSRICSEMRALF